MWKYLVHTYPHIVTRYYILQYNEFVSDIASQKSALLFWQYIVNFCSTYVLNVLTCTFVISILDIPIRINDAYGLSALAKLNFGVDLTKQCINFITEMQKIAYTELLTLVRFSSHDPKLITSLCKFFMHLE